jgi:hypothetical protein
MSIRLAAIVLIVLGALMLAYPVITYTTRETVLDVGPIEVTADDEESVSLPPILGGAALAIGVGLLFVPSRRAGR